MRWLPPGWRQPADDEEGIRAFGFRRFGDGVVDFRLAAVEALYGHSVIRHQRDGRSFGSSITPLMIRFSGYPPAGRFFIEIRRYAPVAAVAEI